MTNATYSSLCLQRMSALAACEHTTGQNQAKIKDGVQAALKREGISASSVQLDSTAFAAPSFASQLCLLQARGYCTGETVASLKS